MVIFLFHFMRTCILLHGTSQPGKFTFSPTNCLLLRRWRLYRLHPWWETSLGFADLCHFPHRPPGSRVSHSPPPLQSSLADRPCPARVKGVAASWWIWARGLGFYRELPRRAPQGAGFVTGPGSSFQRSFNPCWEEFEGTSGAEVKLHREPRTEITLFSLNK